MDADALDLCTGTPSGPVEAAVRADAAGGWMDAEADLVARVARGDVSAFEELYDRYSRPVYALVFRLVRHPDTAQETAQEVFMAAWRSAREFDPGRGSVRSWVLSLAHHKGVDALRRLRLRATEALSDAAETASPNDPMDAAIRAVEHRRVREALQALSPEQREAIVLAYYGGYTQQAIARRKQVPLGTVKTRVRDGMTRLRGLLAPGEEADR